LSRAGSEEQHSEEVGSGGGMDLELGIHPGSAVARKDLGAQALARSSWIGVDEAHAEVADLIPGDGSADQKARRLLIPDRGRGVLALCYGEAGAAMIRRGGAEAGLERTTMVIGSR
jgi:hypothetical protein